MTIRPLEEKFTKWGQVFTRIMESEKGFIYARTDSDGIICYEVFKRRLQTMGTRKFGDRVILPTHDQYVPYPTSENFGEWAWCCKTLERAENILDGLNKETPTEK